MGILTETIDQVKAGFGYVVVKVDEPMIDHVKHGSMILSFNPTFDMYRNVKIKAEVVSVCAKLPKVPFFLRNGGFPPPLQKFQPDGSIFPTPYQAEYVTCADQQNVVDIGETIYFKYLTLMESNYLGKDSDGMKLYKCPYEQIFCTISLGVIVMANGYILVEPLWSEGFEEIEVPVLDGLIRDTGKKRKIRVQQTRSGIIYDIDQKPMALRGTVRHIGVPVDNRNYGIAEGDKIMYLKGSEFKNNIEGDDYYVMKQWDAVAKINDNKILPVGEFVLMHAEMPKKEILWSKKEKKPVKGTILATGTLVNEVKPGDKVYYNHAKSWTMGTDEDGIILCKANQIWATYE